MSILDEREKTHGNYSNVAMISQNFKNLLRCGQSPLTHVQRESLELICMKIARIVCGDPNEMDHWRDIAGYAELIYKKRQTQFGESTQQESSPDEFTDSVDGINRPPYFADG